MRAAIIGCGQIARVHVSALRAARGVDLVAVCDRDVWRARELSELAGGAAVYTDLGAMLAGARPDALHVLTPPPSHAELAIQALEAGVHALVEKPMALRVEEADRMLAAAQSSGARLCCNHNYLFKPSVQEARRRVAAGEIGEVVYVNGYYGLAGEAGSYAGSAGRSHWARQLPGGPFTNFLPHLIYLLFAFMPEVEEVAGVAGAGEAGGDDSEFSALLRSGSTLGALTVSMRARPYAKYVDVYGTEGIVHADLVREVCTVHRNAELPRMLSKVAYNLEDSLQLLSGTAKSAFGVLRGRLPNYPGLHILVDRFYQSLREGTEAPVPGEQGRAVVQLMERIREAAPQAAARAAGRAAVAPLAPAQPVREPCTAAEQEVARRGFPGRVLVTGATGFLGHHLVAALWRAGAEVTALVRDRAGVSAELAAQAHVVQGDLRDATQVAAAMEGVALVYHCAAITKNSERWAAHEATNIAGTRVVLEAARRTGVQRVVHVSSVAVYGLDGGGNGRVLDEAAPYARHPDRWAYYLRSKLAADRLALQEGAAGAPEVTVLRLGILYGPGGGREPARGLVRLGGVRLLVGSGRNALPVTYVGNAVDALLLAGTQPEAAGRAYNVVDDPQRTVREIIRATEQITGERTTLLPVPAGLLGLGARLFEWQGARAADGRPPRLTRYVLQSASRNLRYATDRLRADTGWRPEVSLEEGLLRTLGREPQPR